MVQVCYKIFILLVPSITNRMSVVVRNGLPWCILYSCPPDVTVLSSLLTEILYAEILSSNYGLVI